MSQFVREQGTRSTSITQSVLVQTRRRDRNTWKDVQERQKLTEWTGAFKDRTIKELRRDTWNQINNQHEGETGSQRAKNHTDSPESCHFAPSQKVRPCTVKRTSKGEKRAGTEEDRHPGGGRQKESRGATKEGGAREETRETRSRKSTAGHRPQPWWWPTVEPTVGGAMEEGWPPTPGGWQTAAEQVVEEPEEETESQRTRGMPRIQGARVEDPGGADGRKEPNRAGGTEGWGAARGEESRGDGGSMPDQGGVRGTREPGEADGLTGDGGGEGARSRGGAAGSMGRGGVWASEAGGRGEGILQHLRRWRMADPRGSQCTDRGLRASRWATRRQW